MCLHPRLFEKINEISKYVNLKQTCETLDNFK
jgi:hypothetical protein